MRRVAVAISLLAGMAVVSDAPAQTATGGEPTIRGRHGNWEVRCFGASDCIMTQFHQRSEQTADAVFTLIKPRGLTDENGLPIEALAEIVVPLGVFLPAGLGLQVDNEPIRAAPYERCIPDGCVVRAPISNPMIQKMKAGATANLVISRSPDERVTVPISLSGFTAAYDSF